MKRWRSRTSTTQRDLTVELFAADFTDIFQVHVFAARADAITRPSRIRRCASPTQGWMKEAVRRVCFSPKPGTLEANCALWHCRLAPHGSTRLSTAVTMRVSDGTAEPGGSDGCPLLEVRARSAVRHQSWHQACTRFRSDNEIFDALLRTSIEDFYALRMPEATGTTVAAGVPWFAALFGRDSLSSFETLILNPELASGMLCVLAVIRAPSAMMSATKIQGRFCMSAAPAK